MHSAHLESSGGVPRPSRVGLKIGRHGHKGRVRFRAATYLASSCWLNMEDSGTSAVAARRCDCARVLHRGGCVAPQGQQSVCLDLR